MILMPSVDAWENDQKQEVIQSLREQLEIEGQLVGLYEKYERDNENKAIKRVMQMFSLDSQRHINIIQAAIELLEGEDVYLEDKEPLKESLTKHLAGRRKAPPYRSKKPDNTDLLQAYQQRHGGPIQGRGVPRGQVPQIEAIPGKKVPDRVNVSFKPLTPSYSL